MTKKVAFLLVLGTAGVSIGIGMIFHTHSVFQGWHVCFGGFALIASAMTIHRLVPALARLRRR